MTEIPTISLRRMLLAPFISADAPLVEAYAGDRAVAAMTKNIPHPYPKGSALKWIESHAAQFLTGTNVVFSIRMPDRKLIGCINLKLQMELGQGDLGYWIGKPFWNQGHATEAAQATIAYGFETLGINKIHARHLVSNPASGRVMQKCRMVREGPPSEHPLPDGRLVDLVEYSISRADFVSRT